MVAAVAVLVRANQLDHKVCAGPGGSASEAGTTRRRRASAPTLEVGPNLSPRSSSQVPNWGSTLRDTRTVALYLLMRCRTALPSTVSSKGST